MSRDAGQRVPGRAPGSWEVSAVKSVYRVLAFVIAAEIAVQAAAMAFAVAGLGIWVDEGGTYDAAVLEDGNLPFTGVTGFMIHTVNGATVIPVLALALLVVSDRKSVV